MVIDIGITAMLWTVCISVVSGVCRLPPQVTLLKNQPQSDSNVVEEEWGLIINFK